MIWGTFNAISTPGYSRLSNIKEGNRTAVAGSANPNLCAVHGDRQMTNPSILTTQTIWLSDWCFQPPQKALFHWDCHFHHPGTSRPSRMEVRCHLHLRPRILQLLKNLHPSRSKEGTSKENRDFVEKSGGDHEDSLGIIWYDGIYYIYIYIHYIYI